MNGRLPGQLPDEAAVEVSALVPRFSNKVVLLLISVVTVVGVIDGLVTGDWDVAGLFGLVLAFTVWLWARLSFGRPAVPVRADLVAWLDERAVDGGESVEQVADRAISAYRAGLTFPADSA